MRTFGPARRLQREYEAAIKRLLRKVIPPVQPEQTLQEWLGELADISQSTDVREASEFLARRMVLATDKLNHRTWREAAEKHGQSRKLYRLLQGEMQGATGVRMRQLVRDNAAYISSIPFVQATRLTEEVARAQQAGARAGTIAKMMRSRFPELLKSRVNLISRTETAKASTALTQARCADLNIDWYEWLTSEDARVRASHKKMNGVLVPWSEPPAPEALNSEPSALGHYHSGECPNCRCSQRVILTLDDIQFPARVYWHGAVQRMTKQAFKQIATGLESRAA